MPDSQRFFADPAVDTLLDIVLALGSEVFVLNSQLRHMRQVLEQRGLLTREEWDSYRPDADMREWLASERAAFSARLLEPLTTGERSRVERSVVAPWNPTYQASGEASPSRP
jgi:hypothetical protein